MGLFGWLRGASAVDQRRQAWHREWEAAVATPTRDAHQRLLAQLAPIASAGSAAEDDVEIEEEMLDALDALLTSMEQHAREGLPVISTAHRVVGADVCHFTAPVSMPDESGQPSGRLLLTGTRAIFIGAAAPRISAWHATAEVARSGRDLLLVRRSGDGLARFRCNTFADAVCAAFVARQLAGRRGPA